VAIASQERIDFMATELLPLQQQIDALRRDLKRQRLLNTFLLIAGLVAIPATRVISQSPPPKDFTVRSIKVIGPEGKTRVIISGDPVINRNGGAIAVLDDQENVRIGLMADQKGGNVSLLRKSGDPVAMLGFDGKGGVLSLTDAQGKGKINAAALPDATGVNIQASDGKSDVNLAAASRATGLQVRTGGWDRVIAGTDKNGGTVEVYDGAGNLKKKLQ
jgi:hypothetical protein